MKFCLILSVLLAFVFSAKGQNNLLFNGSFEVTDSCPNQVAQVWLANGWHIASATPDLLDSCAKVWYVDVPYNYFGFSHAQHGTKYVHLNLSFLDSVTVFNYETISYKLNQSLAPGRTYCLSFWLKQTNNARYAYDKLGVLFTTNYYNQLGGKINEAPQLETPTGEVLDFDDWTKIEFEYTATGNEIYMVVGQFNTFQELTILDKRPALNKIDFSYFLDNFELTDCTQPPVVTIPNVFTPNNDGQNDQFFIEHSHVKKIHIAIYSRWGSQVFTSTDLSFKWDGLFDGKELAEGVYFYHLNYTGINEETINKTGSIHLMR